MLPLIQFTPDLVENELPELHVRIILLHEKNLEFSESLTISC